MPSPDWPQPHHDFTCDFSFRVDDTYVRYFHYSGAQEFFRSVYPAKGNMVDLLSLPFDTWINGLMIHADNLLDGNPMEII